MDTATPRHPAERPLAWAAAACWLAAWFLPVLDNYAGWEGFVVALTGHLPGVTRTVAEESVPQTLSALTNVVFVAMWFAWWRGPLKYPAIYLKVGIACLLANFYWLVQLWRAGMPGALRPGYYVWLAAFALLVALATVIVASARRTSKTPTAGTPA